MKTLEEKQKLVAVSGETASVSESEVQGSIKVCVLFSSSAAPDLLFLGWQGEG